MLNRALLIVRPQQPFLDWAAQLDDSGVLPDADGEQTAYLVPDIADGEDRVLKAVFAEVFERELNGWHRIEAAWPKNRNLAMFRRWFKIEFHSVVEDLCGFELVDEDI